MNEFEIGDIFCVYFNDISSATIVTENIEGDYRCNIYSSTLLQEEFKDYSNYQYILKYLGNGKFEEIFTKIIITNDITFKCNSWEEFNEMFNDYRKNPLMVNSDFLQKIENVYDLESEYTEDQTTLALKRLNTLAKSILQDQMRIVIEKDFENAIEENKDKQKIISISKESIKKKK